MGATDPKTEAEPLIESGQRISLVVPLHNEETSARRLVESILAQTRSPDEVVLVDGGSTDRTVAILTEAVSGDRRFRIIESGPSTPGAARNIGIATARHEWVALTDAGIRLEPTWLERLVSRAQETPGVDIVYGNYEPDLHSAYERCAALAYVPLKQKREGGWARGPSIATCLLRKSVWSAVGGFPDLRASEDLIFMDRVAQTGCRIAWAPSATVWWSIQSTPSATFRKFVLYSKHNVLAGRQRFWHYGMARQYAMALPFLLLAAFENSTWMIVPLAAALLRSAKSIWVRREGRGICWVLNPARLLGVLAVIALIDTATYLGWIEAILLTRRGQPGRSGGAVQSHGGSE